MAAASAPTPLTALPTDIWNLFRDLLAENFEYVVSKEDERPPILDVFHRMGDRRLSLFVRLYYEERGQLIPTHPDSVDEWLNHVEGVTQQREPTIHPYPINGNTEADVMMIGGEWFFVLRGYFGTRPAGLTLRGHRNMIHELLTRVRRFYEEKI